MPDPWFTESGVEGILELRYVDEKWVAAVQETDETVRCILEGDTELSPTAAPHRVSGTVSKYVIGSGNRDDYLYFEVEADPGDPKVDDRDENERSGSTNENTVDIRERSSYPYRELADIDGSGEYVSVVARLEHIYWVRKEGSEGPDLKGRLTDGSIDHGVAFVVDEGVSHPYFDEDMWFLFDNVYDYYWDAEDQVTIWISEQTQFTEIRPVDETNTSISADQSDASTTDSGGEDTSLDHIAREKIGDTVFTLEEDRESSISEAKRKAKDQQRDPAIDPKFLPDEEE